MGNSYQKRDAYYGAFQGNFLKRIAALFPDRRRTLHLFAGRVDLAAFPGLAGRQPRFGLTDLSVAASPS
jgi:hypothetical protein